MERQEIERLKQELIELRKDQDYFVKRIEKLEQELSVLSGTYNNLSPESATESVSSSIPKELNAADQIEESVPPGRPQAVHEEPERDLEFHIGGTWLNRIGVIAVIFGLAYFLKYSIENQWIGPTGRVLLGVLTGLGMLGIGEKLRHRYPGYAQGLLGGGSLALFFSIYVSYDFYDLISPAFAFIFLLLVMANTVVMAIRHDSLPIGILGIIGGYAIPFMVGSDDPSLWTLFSYAILLTTGVLGVSIYKKWAVFQYLSFLLNHLVFGLIWVEFFLFGSADWHILPSFIFLALNFILFLAVATLYNIRQKKTATRWDISLIMLNAFLFFAWSLDVLDRTFIGDYMGFYAVFLALIYIYLGKVAYRLFNEDKGQVYGLFAIAFVLITVAIPLQLSGLLIGLAWLAESVGLIAIARKLSNQKMVYSGLAVLMLGLVVTIDDVLHIGNYKTFLLNNPTLMIISSLFAIAVIVKLIEGMSPIRFYELDVSFILKGLFLILVFIGLTVENQHFFLLTETDFFLSPEQLSLSALWLLYAIVLFMIGIRKRIRYLRYVALGLLAIVIMKAFFVDLANLATMYKILLFIVLGLCLLGISYFYQKTKDTIQGKEESR
jgi:uncharacterized membrane protein